MGPDGRSILGLGSMRSRRHWAGATTLGRVRPSSGLLGWDELCSMLTAMKGLHTEAEAWSPVETQQHADAMKGQLWASRDHLQRSDPVSASHKLLLWFPGQARL